MKEKPFAPLPFHISYHVKLIMSENKITYVIKGIPFLNPILFYSFDENPDKTELHFSIKINGFVGVKYYLGYKMTKAMDKLMANIENH